MSMQPPNTPSTPGFGGSTPSAANVTKITPRRTNRVFLLGIIVLTGLAFLLVVVGTGSGSQTWVLMSNQAIKARDPINPDLFEAKQIADDAIVAGAVTGSSEAELSDKIDELALDGATAQYPLPKGGQLSESLISTETELARPLGANERLVSFPGSYSATLAGAVKVGDRVDVYVVGDNQMPVANLLVPDVEVVGIALPESQVSSLYQKQVAAAETGDQLTVAEITPSDPIPGVFTVRVDQSDAPAIAVAAEHASIVLVYRGTDAQSTIVDPLSLAEVLCAPRIPAVTGDEETDPIAGYQPAALPLVCAGQVPQ